MTALAFFLGVIAGGTVGAIGTALAIAGSDPRTYGDAHAGRIIVLDGGTDGATGRCLCGRCKRPVEPQDEWCRHCGARL